MLIYKRQRSCIFETPCFDITFNYLICIIFYFTDLVYHWPWNHNNRPPYQRPERSCQGPRRCPKVVVGMTSSLFLFTSRRHRRYWSLLGHFRGDKSSGGRDVTPHAKWEWLCTPYYVWGIHNMIHADFLIKIAHYVGLHIFLFVDWIYRRCYKCF